MLRVTIEILPHGREKDKKVIGVAEIWNTLDHPERPRMGNYKFKIYKLATRQRWKTGEVHDFARQYYGAWQLLNRVLNIAFPKVRKR